MDKIKDYDGDGFELIFEDETTPEEKKYFVQTYTIVDTVAERRLHCTCCDTHIGTAPSAEKIIRMHPVLRVTQCIKCFRFYNSGEFEKGEDGSELYCRWCGQGGDVYCCSDCPYVFCKKCILRNLTKVALNDVTSNDNWKCFSCAPKILYHLRAQHWALVNFIEKQKNKLLPQQKTLDPDEFADAMNKDVSQCCKSKKKSIDSPKKRKITYANDSDNDSNDSNWNRRRKKKKTGVVDSDSDAASIDSERSTKRRRAAATASNQMISVEALAAASKSNTSVAQEKAVSSITKNPNIQVKKVAPNQSTPPSTLTARKSTTQTLSSVNASRQQPPAAAAAVATASTDSTEIDDDLFAFLVNHSYEQTVGSIDQTAENSVSSSTSVRAPPPLTPSTSTAIPANNSAMNSMTDKQVIDVPMESNQATRVAGQTQYVRRVQRYQSTQQASAPVIHNYNGYRIDLNKAAQQSTLRLPNGKVIHVKKQTAMGRNDSSTNVRYSITSAMPTSTLPPQPVINQPSPGPRPSLQSVPYHPVRRTAAAMAANRMAVRPTALSRSIPPPNILSRPPPPNILGQPPPPLVINSVSSGVVMPPAPAVQSGVGHLGFQQAQMQMQQMLRQQNAHPVRMPLNAGPMMPTTAPPQAMSAAATAAASATPNIPLPRIYGNDPVGKARTQLERQIFNSIQICHQIDGKLKTLMNSNAYKNAKKMHDIKELYIHLSYLFTYTNGRFQSVHDKCMEDMRRLGFKNDASSLSSGNFIDKYGSDVDDDDLEIVEPRHQTINVDDSDDERTPEKSKSKNSTPQKNATKGGSSAAAAAAAAPTTMNSGRQAMMDITSSTENLECDVDITSLLQIAMNEHDEDDENGESLLRRMNDDVGIGTPPDFEQNDEVNILNDIKLNSKAVVTLKPVEQDFPDLVEKARQKNKIQEQAAEESQSEESKAPAENETEIDGSKQQQQQLASEKESTQDQIVQEKTVSETTNNDATETINLDDSVESKNSDSECTNSNVADSVQQTKEANNQIDDIEMEQSHAIEQSLDNKQKETTEEAEIESKEPQQNEQESDESPPQQPESQAEQNENCEPTAQNENSNDGDVTTVHDDTDFTENEAQSIDDSDDENCGGGGGSGGEKENASNEAECHGEITVTSTNETENDVEMHEISDNDEDTTATDKNDCESNNDGSIQMNEIAVSDVDIADVANEIIANEEIITDETPLFEEASDQCIAFEETVAGGSGDDLDNDGNGNGNEQPANETESIFSDLSDCNQLANDDISNAISTSASLDVASLLESGDFENISSPEAFN